MKSKRTKNLSSWGFNTQTPKKLFRKCEQAV